MTFEGVFDQVGANARPPELHNEAAAHACTARPASSTLPHMHQGAASIAHGVAETALVIRLIPV